MIPGSVRIAIRTYRWLLYGYPPPYRQRFASEMIQVFSLLCRDCYQQSGPVGLAGLWLMSLWDWAWTAADRWIDYLLGERKTPMNTGLDQQLGDLVWSIATGLRAGYRLPEVFQALATEAPEPAASACKRLLAEFEKDQELRPALDNWQHAIPSAALPRLVEVLKQSPEDGNLLSLLDLLSEELLRECGSDPAFYAPMRREAEQLGAKVPERVSKG